jgi:hypothetical protein
MEYGNYREHIGTVDGNPLHQPKKVFEELLVALPLCASLPCIPKGHLSELSGLIELIEVLRDVHEGVPNPPVHGEQMK